MVLEGRLHCDGPGCEHSAYVSVRDMAAGRLPLSHLRLVEYDNGGQHEWGFCSRDCVMRWCAESPPTEVIRLDDQGEARDGE